MKQKEPNRKQVIDGMQERIQNKRVAGSLSIMIITILTMTLMSGCAASLTDFGYKGGLTTTVNPNRTINTGYGAPSQLPDMNLYSYDPTYTVYYLYSGTFDSSETYQDFPNW